jgi:hypothetical protein
MPSTTSRPELHVGWLMPDFFHPLPVDVTGPDELADDVVELTRKVLADRSTDEQHFFAQMLLRQTGQLIEAEADYAGMCFVEHEGEPTMATVLVNRVPSLEDTVEEAAAATDSLLRRRYPHDEVRTTALPLEGTPAVTRVGSLETSVPPELSPDGQPQTLRQGVIQTYVPLPGQGETMVFELTSPSAGAWTMYTEMFDAILGTLDWATDEDLAERRDLERIAASATQPQTIAGGTPPAPERLDQTSIATLRLRSSLILDAVGLRGPMPGDADQLTSSACPECRSKGLTSGYTVRHHWEMTRLTPTMLEEMLAAARSRLTERGWTEEAAGDGSLLLSVPADSEGSRPCRASLTADNAQGRLLVDVTTACDRGEVTGLADDFG